MKTYKFWNPNLVDNYQQGLVDGHTCTAEELTIAEDKNSGVTSTTIELNDDRQAAAVAELIVNEWNGEPRYAEVFK